MVLVPYFLKNERTTKAPGLRFTSMKWMNIFVLDCT